MKSSEKHKKNRPVILIAPNAFRDCMSARQAALAIEKGVARACPQAHINLLPLSDGGDGFLNVSASLHGMEIRTIQAPDPLERNVETRFLYNPRAQLAMIEMAEISGLKWLKQQERNPLRTTTRGTGACIREALDAGARHIIVGVGGSATMDAGAGALHELGARFKDKTGRVLHPSPHDLKDTTNVDLSGLDSRLADTELILFCDVATSLKASMETFGGQKGARPEDAEIYRSTYQALAILGAEKGVDMLEIPLLGAGGGLPAGLTAFAGGQPRSGADGVAEMFQLSQEIQKADLVFTGEGKLDAGSLDGKLPMNVARKAALNQKPCLILAGQLDPNLYLQLPETCSAFSLVNGPMTLQNAMNQAPELLEDLSCQLLRLFLHQKDQGGNNLPGKFTQPEC